MTTSDQIKALVRAHVNGDNERFRLTVQQIAAHDEKRSPEIARDLRRLIDPPGTSAGTFMRLGEADESGLLMTAHRTPTLADLVVSEAIRVQLERVLKEQRAADKLREHNLLPAGKLLFVGPPGVGKTMAAGAIATELGLPLRVVNLHNAIDSHLGESAKKLSKVFDQISVFRAVYLFDEFDALASRRDGGNGTDVGEMKRLVNSILMFMDRTITQGVIIATTNLADVIDRAMFRRFDMTLDFTRTDEALGLEVVRRTLIKTDGIEWHRIARVVHDASHADLVTACNTANKDMVIAGADRIETTDLVWAIKMRCEGAKLPEKSPKAHKRAAPPVDPVAPGPQYPLGLDS